MITPRSKVPERRAPLSPRRPRLHPKFRAVDNKLQAMRTRERVDSIARGLPPSRRALFFPEKPPVFSVGDLRKPRQGLRPVKRRGERGDCIEVRWIPPPTGEGHLMVQEPAGQRKALRGLRSGLQPDAGTTIEYSHSEATLRREFARFGEIVSVRLNDTGRPDPLTGKPVSRVPDRAVVRFADPENAARAGLSKPSYTILSICLRRPVGETAADELERRGREERAREELVREADMRRRERVLCNDGIRQALERIRFGRNARSQWPKRRPTHARDPAFCHLDLSHKCLEDGDVAPLFDALSSNTTITSLDLSHNRLTDNTVSLLLNILPDIENPYACTKSNARRPNRRLRVVRLDYQRPPAAYKCDLRIGDLVEAKCRSGHGKPLGTFFPAKVVSVPLSATAISDAALAAAESGGEAGAEAARATLHTVREQQAEHDYGGFGGEAGGYMVEFEDGERANNLPRCFIRKGMEYDVSEEALRRLDAALQINADCTPVGLSNGLPPQGKSASALKWAGVPYIISRSGGWFPPAKADSSATSHRPFIDSALDPQNPRAGCTWRHPGASHMPRVPRQLIGVPQTTSESAQMGRNEDRPETSSTSLKDYSPARNNAIFLDGFGDAKRHWLEIDLGCPRVISAVATQGRGDADCWVTTYKVQYKRSNNLLLKAAADGPDGFYTIKQSRADRGNRRVGPGAAGGVVAAGGGGVLKRWRRDRIFIGNKDRCTLKLNRFEPVEARWIRILPWSINEEAEAAEVNEPLRRVALRLELYYVHGAQCTAHGGEPDDSALVSAAAVAANEQAWAARLAAASTVGAYAMRMQRWATNATHSVETRMREQLRRIAGTGTADNGNSNRKGSDLPVQQQERQIAPESAAASSSQSAELFLAQQRYRVRLARSQVEGSEADDNVCDSDGNRDDESFEDENKTEDEGYNARPDMIGEERDPSADAENTPSLCTTTTPVSPSIQPWRSKSLPLSLPKARSMQHAASVAAASLKARMVRVGKFARHAIIRRSMRTSPSPKMMQGARTTPTPNASAPAASSAAEIAARPASATRAAGKVNGRIVPQLCRRPRPETARPAVGSQYASAGRLTRAVRRQRPATASNTSTPPVVHRSRSEPLALDYETLAELEEERSVRVAALRRMSDTDAGAATATVESTDDKEDDVVFV